MKKVMTALSGGVDSSVSALLLKKQGFDVSGVFMRHRYQRTLDFEESQAVLRRFCESVQLRVLSAGENGAFAELAWEDKDLPFFLPVDAASALEVASSMGVDLTIVDIDVPFSRVVEDFIDRYYSAQTPNPCVLCNRLVKFGILWDIAQALGASFFATGHYAQTIRVGTWLERLEKTPLGRDVSAEMNPGFNEPPEWLKRDVDSVCVLRSPSPKDQSYFLCRIERSVLNRTLFPVGGYQKSRVREIASENRLHVANRGDSQEICFIPDKERVDFIRKIRDSQPDRWGNVPEDTSGPFLSLDGREIGRHSGYERFTIGQRKGLGVGFGERVFVQKINPELKAVTLGSYEDLAVSKIHAVDVNWHAAIPIEEPFRCCVKIRYRNEGVPATVRAFSDGTLVAITDRPCYGVAPGQALVCYWRDRLLGGGTIIL